MSFDFANVRAQEVPRERTATYTFYRLAGQPTLEVRPATEANPAYMRAMLKGSRDTVRRLKAGGDLSPELLSENREKDRKLFPKYVVVGWPKKPVDVSGGEVDFCEEACAGFIAALPYDMFNDLRDFCSTIDNFRPSDDNTLSDEDEEALRKN